MSNIVKKITASVSLFILVVFVVFLFNQTPQIVHYARALNV